MSEMICSFRLKENADVEIFEEICILDAFKESRRKSLLSMFELQWLSPSTSTMVGSLIVDSYLGSA